MTPGYLAIFNDSRMNWFARSLGLGWWVQSLSRLPYVFFDSWTDSVATVLEMDPLRTWKVSGRENNCDMHDGIQNRSKLGVPYAHDQLRSIFNQIGAVIHLQPQYWPRRPPTIGAKCDPFFIITVKNPIARPLRHYERSSTLRYWTKSYRWWKKNISTAVAAPRAFFTGNRLLKTRAAISWPQFFAYPLPNTDTNPRRVVNR